MNTTRRRYRAHPGRRSERGQALVLALAAIAMGALLVTPFLTHVSVSVLATRHAEEAIDDEYAVDAGIEWGLWRLKNDPLLTSSATYVSAPLLPAPGSIDGAAFPTVEIRRVAGANATQTIAPAWVGGGGTQCYAFTSAEDGPAYAIIETGAATLQADIRSTCDGTGLPTLAGPSPYYLSEPGASAGSYYLVLVASPPTIGTVTITFSAASYDIRSQRDGRTATARATASASAVEVISWQLN
jgi:hypothetical protein